MTFDKIIDFLAQKIGEHPTPGPPGFQVNREGGHDPDDPDQS